MVGQHRRSLATGRCHIGISKQVEVALPAVSAKTTATVAVIMVAVRQSQCEGSAVEFYNLSRLLEFSIWLEAATMLHLPLHVCTSAGRSNPHDFA